MRAGTLAAAVLVALLIFPAMSLARDGKGPEGPGMKSRLSSELFAKLGLDESTANALKTDLDAIMQERMEHIRILRQSMESLSRELEQPAPAERNLKRLMDAIDAAEKKLQSLRQKETEVLKKHLSLVQRARYINLRMEDRRQGRSKGYEDGGQKRPMDGQRLRR